MIVLVFVAVTAAVASFVLLLSHGVLIAMFGAALSSSLLTAASAVALARWRDRPSRRTRAMSSPSSSERAAASDETRRAHM